MEYLLKLSRPGQMFKLLLSLILIEKAQQRDRRQLLFKNKMKNCYLSDSPNTVQNITSYISQLMIAIIQSHQANIVYAV